MIINFSDNKTKLNFKLTCHAWNETIQVSKTGLSDLLMKINNKMTFLAHYENSKTVTILAENKQLAIDYAMTVYSKIKLVKLNKSKNQDSPQKHFAVYDPKLNCFKGCFKGELVGKAARKAMNKQFTLKRNNLPNSLVNIDDVDYMILREKTKGSSHELYIFTGEHICLCNPQDVHFYNTVVRYHYKTHIKKVVPKLSCDVKLIYKE
jgi:hypothetical protein